MGAAGTNGKTILSGTVDPTSVGANGDFYINTTTRKIFGPKTNGTWGIGTSLIGAQGLTGTAGTNGTNGKTVLNGTSNPTSQGTDGDFYINTATKMIFGPKSNGLWGNGSSLTGPQGAPGLQGLTGASGANGTDGKTIISGTIDPTAEGTDGDFFINTSTNKIFGPKTSGGWGNGVSLTGAQGQAGSNGADGKTILNGSVDPTSEGTNGDFYLNTSTQKLFGPKTNGGWGSGVSLLGGGGWTLTGNAGTIDGTHFIGTTDNAPLTLKVNNQMAGKIGTLGNTFYGLLSGNATTTGNLNTGIGRNAFSSNTTGTQNTALGYFSLSSNTTGFYNTAIGAAALGNNLVGHDNTAVGSNALQQTTGSFNTGVGMYALSPNTSGSNNTALGWKAGLIANNLNNATAIGANAIVNSSNTIQLGDGNVTQVKAGTGTNATLIAGGLQVTGGTPAAGKVLTSDATGVATWQTPTAGGWGLTGNAGTMDGTNFIGTTDNIPFNIRVNNQKAGRIDPIKFNTFYGYQAGNGVTGKNNIAIGYQSLTSTTSKSDNVAIGANSLKMNVDGYENLAIGSNALRNNYSGILNIGIGVGALYQNTIGTYNTAVGSEAMAGTKSGAENVALGGGALGLYNESGSQNTAIGRYAMAVGGNGSNATAVGYGAMMNTWVPFWDNSLAYENYNVAVGYEALRGSNDQMQNLGNYNTALGSLTLHQNSWGGYNTANGYKALNSNYHGSNNTAVGFSSLLKNTSGNNNTALGYQADVASNNLTNATAIGANATVTASNNMIFGDANVVGWGFGVSPLAGADAIRVGSNATNGNGATLSLGGTWTNASDRNKKENFIQLNGPEVLSKIKQLPITRWNYKGESPTITHIGPMAQDFHKLFNVGNDDKSISTIDPAGVALAGIQELIKQIEEMRKQIQALNAENSNLKSQMAAFKLYEDRLQRLEQLLTSKANELPQTQETK